ncbi:class I SAM-dependent methyltransferase [Candidatus Bipolaricaulota bacterium]|nr:class I SAM-dependent methyltransferase [Candidatus Bipolaricaulota bacterium]
MKDQNPFETHYCEYDAWFDSYDKIYRSELLAVQELLPKNGNWVEIGVGSGRFASKLGIKTGVEPAEGIATLAMKRGVTVLKGRAEELPLDDESIDAAFLITTLCFVDELGRTFTEAFRVIRPGGAVIVAFIPQDSPFGELYGRIAGEDRFYRLATFYTKENVFTAMTQAGFLIDRTVQTLTGSPEQANDAVEAPTEGHAKGSFIVVRANKP